MAAEWCVSFQIPIVSKVGYKNDRNFY